ncbi:hypothetical protein D3C72_560090 [compost metagenome]
MLAQALSGRRNVFFAFSRKGKIHLDEMAQVKSALQMLHTVIRQNHQGIAFRHRVGEGFLIGEQLSALHVTEQGTEQNIRRLFLCGR